MMNLAFVSKSNKNVDFDELAMLYYRYPFGRRQEHNVYVIVNISCTEKLTCNSATYIAMKRNIYNK